MCPQTTNLPEGTGGAGTGTPALTDAEVVQLQIRVIALENMVIALLANASGATHDNARALAAHILPRPGFTQHRLPRHAAHQIDYLLDRARHIDRAGDSRSSDPLPSAH